MNTVKRNSALLLCALTIISPLLVSTASRSSPVPVVELRPVEFPLELTRWYECATAIAADSPVSDKELRRVFRTIHDYSPTVEPDFLRLAVAVAMTESNMNRIVQSPAGAVGLMQLTLIGAKEAERQCPVLRPTLGESDTALLIRLLGLTDNVKYGTCLLDYYLKQTEGNVFHALVLYNGGYQQLTRLTNTGTLTPETTQYVLRVHSLLGRCR